MHILDPTDVESLVHEHTPPQDTAEDIPDQMETAGRSYPYPLIGIHHRHILDRHVMTDTVDSPGIRLDVVPLLFRPEQCDTSEGGA